MRRYLTPSLIVAATLSFPLTAFAQEACPSGAWFCQADDAASRDAAPEAEAIPPPPQADSLPVPEERTAPSESRDGRMPPPPVVVYQPRQTTTTSAQIIIIAPGGTRVVRKAPPPVHVRRAPVVVRRTHVRTVTPVRATCAGGGCWKSEWGLNARLEGIGFGNGGDPGKAKDAGMGGFGVSLRYRPWARFAIDAGFDIIGGTDLNGFERVEVPFSVNGMLYFNPRSRSQFYVIGGVNWSQASVTSNSASPLLAPTKDGSSFSADYKYFGGQLGVGLEFRLSKRLSFNVDALGFMRSRTDVDDGDGHHGKAAAANAKAPEFYDPISGQTTNKSGGGLFRGGLTLWW